MGPVSLLIVKTRRRVVVQCFVDVDVDVAAVVSLLLMYCYR